MGEEREEERGAGRSRREEETHGDAQATKAQGEKREAEGDGMEFAGSGRQAEPSGDGMSVEAVMMNDEEAWDDVKGCWTERKFGRQGWKKCVNEVPRRTASEHRIVSVKWVDTNKGTEEDPEIRCKLVARDFRGSDKDRTICSR